MTQIQLPKGLVNRSKNRQAEPARLELTLEMPRQRHDIDVPEDVDDEASRGVALVDFYI